MSSRNAELRKPPSSVVSSTSSRSCITCRRRKVKCDKGHPCAHCTRYGVSCVFPLPGRARPTPRLRTVVMNDQPHPEDLMKAPTSPGAVNDPAAGAGSSRSAGANDSAYVSQYCDRGMLEKENFIERLWYLGNRLPRSLYCFDTESDPQLADIHTVDNSVYFSALASLEKLLQWPGESEVATHVVNNYQVVDNVGGSDPAEDLVQDFSTNATAHGFIFGYTAQSSALADLHPPPSQIQFYWQIYVDNVDSIVKVLHVVETAKLIREFPGRLRSLTRSEEALLFAIYFAAVTSMRLEEVQELLDQDKATLVAKYRLGTEQALAKAELMVSDDLMTLQAFVIYISCLPPDVQPQLVCNLTALAVRIAQGLRIGHHDSHCRWSLYESEMKKRLWLSIWLLDFRTALDLGGQWLLSGDLSAADLPLNINDSDIDRASSNCPVSTVGMTNMSFVLVHYELCNLIKQLHLEQNNLDVYAFDSTKANDTEQAVKRCKANLESHYLRYCIDEDPSQWLVAAYVRGFFATIPLAVYFPFLTSGTGTPVSPEIRDILLEASCETIEASHVLETMSGLSRRGWLFRTTLHWHAIAFILQTLSLQSNQTEKARRSWNAIELALGFWNTLSRNPRRDGVWSMLVDLMIRAKSRREQGQSLYNQECTPVNSGDKEQEAANVEPNANISSPLLRTNLPRLIIHRETQDQSMTRTCETAPQAHTPLCAISAPDQTMSSEELQSHYFEGSYLSGVSGDSLLINRDSSMSLPLEDSTEFSLWGAGHECSDNLNVPFDDNWESWSNLFSNFGSVA